MFRIISPPTDPTPTYVADSIDELAEIKRQQWDGNVVGIACLVLDNGDGKPMLWVMDSSGRWV